MRRILRVVKTTVVLSIVFLMTVDSANACRLIRLLFQHQGKACCHTASVCDGSCGGGVASAPALPIVSTPIVSAPIVSTPIVESFPIVSAPIVSDIISAPIVSDYVSAPIVSAAPAGNCCCCAGVQSAPIVDSFVPSGVIDDGFVENGYVESYPTDGYPVEAAPMMESYDSGTVIEGDIYQPSPVEVVPSDGTIITPYDSGSDSFITPIPASEDSMPAVEAPVDSPLDSAVDPPADAGGDSVFTEPAGDAGADEGFGGAGGGADDGFGGLGGGPADADDTFSAPADDVPEAPAEDNLFNDGGAGAADDLPGDDMFNDGGGDAPFDAAPDGDNLFEGGGDAAPGGDDAPIDDADDLFSATGAGGDTMSTSSEAGTTTGDHLFESTPVEDVLPDAPLDDAPVGDDMDDLFGKKSNASESMRVWTDNTGKYKTVGRLVVIAKTHVRLLKENGRHSTVPLNRLSNSDLDYVMAVAKRLSDSKGLASL